MVKEPKTTGLILKGIGGLYHVKTPLGVIKCKARGIFRKTGISPLAGDNVTVDEIAGETGIITEILERKNSLLRPPAANLDIIVFVISTCEPSPNLNILDRFMAIAEYKGIKSMIAVTKRDLKKFDAMRDIYKDSGAEIYEIDYDIPHTYSRLYDALAGKISVFSGNTGVGKSTLLNSFGFGLETGEISKKLGRGRHTTRQVELFELENGGYAADTPGFSSIDVGRYDIILKGDIQSCFREFDGYTGKCRFSDCSHTKEKGCAIIEAVENGLISRQRHESYIMMYKEAGLIKEWEHNG